MNNDTTSTLTVAFCAGLMVASLMISAIAIEKAETAIKIAKKSEAKYIKLKNKFILE